MFTVVRERLVIHARFSGIGPTSLPGGVQNVAPIHLVVQAVEAELGVTLGFGLERSPLTKTQRSAESLQRCRVVRFVTNHRLLSSC